MDQRRQPLEVGEAEWSYVRRLWAGEARTQEEPMGKFDEKTDSLLSKLIASPYTDWIVGAVLVAGAVLLVVAYFK